MGGFSAADSKLPLVFLIGTSERGRAPLRPWSPSSLLQRAGTQTLLFWGHGKGTVPRCRDACLQRPAEATRMGLLFSQARPGPGREDTAGIESESIGFSLPTSWHTLRRRTQAQGKGLCSDLPVCPDSPGAPQTLYWEPTDQGWSDLSLSWFKGRSLSGKRGLGPFLCEGDYVCARARPPSRPG